MASTLSKGTKEHTDGKRNGSSTPGVQANREANGHLLPPQPEIQNLKSEIRNPGMPLDLDWVYGTRINRSAVERRAATLVTRRTVKREWQAAWLLRAVTCIDLTTLAGDDTPGNVRRLCAKARRPVRDDLLEALGARQLNLTVGAVCVYH